MHKNNYKDGYMFNRHSRMFYSGILWVREAHQGWFLFSNICFARFSVLLVLQSERSYMIQRLSDAYVKQVPFVSP